MRYAGTVATLALSLVLATGDATGNAGGERPSAAQEFPPGVTRETVIEGRDVYLGEGLCYVCHGRRGDGVERAGSSLRDTLWYHSDGSYRSITELTRRGISARASATNIPMPPRGGSEIDEDEVRSAAAYVWWISRGGDPGGPGPRQ